MTMAKINMIDAARPLYVYLIRGGGVKLWRIRHSWKRGFLMSKNSQIVVLNETVRIQRMDQDDYISLTDIAKFKNPDDPRFVIQNWMRTRSSIEFLGIWELLNNPDFNRIEFDTVKNQSGSKTAIHQMKLLLADVGARRLEGKQP